MWPKEGLAQKGLLFWNPVGTMARKSQEHLFWILLEPYLQLTLDLATDSSRVLESSLEKRNQFIDWNSWANSYNKFNNLIINLITNWGCNNFIVSFSIISRDDRDFYFVYLWHYVPGILCIVELRWCCLL